MNRAELKLSNRELRERSAHLRAFSRWVLEDARHLCGKSRRLRKDIERLILSNPNPNALSKLSTMKRGRIHLTVIDGGQK
jgi:hypothetical protein